MWLARAMVDLRRLRLAVLACTVLALAGCSSVVDGTGATVAASPTKTGGSTSSAAPGPVAFPRKIITTGALSDPVSVDICTAIGLPAMSTFGYLPEFSDIVVPPSCAVRMSKNGVRYFTVNMYADYAGRVSTGPGRTVSSLSGLPVYSFPYDKSLGNCQRNIAVAGATIKVNVVPNRAAGTPNPTDICRGANAMTARLAQLSATGAAAFPRLALASPSLSRFDFCAVLKAVDLTKYPGFAGGVISDDGFTSECAIDKGGLYLDFELGTAGPPPETHLQSVGGHKLYTDDDATTFCDWYSVQGSTSAGKSERLALSSNITPAGLCTQTGQLLAAILDKAGIT